MNIEGLEVNSPEYWEIRHQRDTWPRWSKWALELTFDSIPVAARVLICAGGQGMEAIQLSKHRPDLSRILSFDIAPTATKKARINAEEMAEIGLEFETIDVFDLSSHIEAGSFDYAISLQNLEHWEPNTQLSAVRQMFKTLGPHGKLFITGVGKRWSLQQMNTSSMEYNGTLIDVPNDYHYNNWSEQDLYDLTTQIKDVASVKFYKRRGKNRMIAEIQKGAMK